MRPLRLKLSLAPRYAKLQPIESPGLQMSTDHSYQIADIQVKRPIPLQRRLWQSYLRAAIVPLLVIELGLIAVFWISTVVTQRENLATLGAVSRGLLSEVARQQAGALGQELAGYSGKTKLFAAQTARALDGPYRPSGAELARHRFDPDGSIYSTRDIGGGASFYSSKTRPGPDDLARRLRLAALDPLMIDIQRSTPGVISLYFNTADSYNRIYPYIDAGAQYPHDMNIPAYNFYYQANGAHNPKREAVWTDAYIDPAGHGWMISSIAPVWKGNRLEGVVGLDIGLEVMIRRLIEMRLPWDAYAMLVDRSGRIIALPPAGEDDFKMRELTAHAYDQTIRQDRFKPDSFNLNRRADTRPLAEAMRRSDSGLAELRFDGLHYASFATVPGPGWRLVVIAPAHVINAPVIALAARLRLVGYAMFGVLLLFYGIFFVFLYRRARALSAELARPIGDIAQVMARIGEGAHRQTFAGAEVGELDALGRDLVAMGHRLGDAHDRIVAQELVLREAYARQRQMNEQNARLVQVMSHELRTPLALIDSGAQIIDRKADSLAPADLRSRSARLRSAVRRIAELIDKLVASLSAEGEDRGGQAALAVPVDLARAVANACARFDPEHVAITRNAELVALADPGALDSALNAVLDNALRYSGKDGTATVEITREENWAVITIEDSGPGLSAAELGQAGALFFRGANATSSAGAGVSLHLARRRLAESGGTLALGPGSASGLRVRIVLPLAGDLA